MAQWRERGYVPDSDDEDEESFPQTFRAEERPHQSEDAERLPGRIEVTVSEPHSNAGTTSLLTTNSGNDLKSVEIAPSSNIQDPLRLPASNGEKSYTVHDVDSVELDYPMPSASPVAERLQASLELGLRQVGEALRIATSVALNIENGSQSSSPLSSLGGGFRTPSSEEELSLLPPEEWLTQAPVRANPQPIPEIVIPRRALRERTQIQLHPYALEDARYQQEFKARGLKPVRIAASQSQHPKSSALSAERDASLFSSSPMEEASAPAPTFVSTQDEIASHLDSANKIGFEQPSSPLGDANSDEELPDLAELFGNKNTRLRSSPPRRVRKQDAVSSRAAEYGTFNIFDLLEDEEGTAHRSSPGPPALIVPPSPPLSESVSRSDEAGDKQHDRSSDEATPGQLPTPLLSSEMRSRKRSIVELSDSSQHALEEDSGTETSLSSSEEEPGKLGKIKAMRRRMKGVLPASWIKLDLKQQIVRENGRKDVQSRRATSSRIGVAKPVSTARPQSGVARPSSNLERDSFHLDLSDEDVSSDNGGGLEVHTGDDNSGKGIFTTDVLENNRVDTMPPEIQRRPKSVSRPKRKRQQRLPDPWQETSSGREQRPTVSGNPRNTKAHRAPRTKRRKRENAVPRLGVLDAPDFVQLARASQPRFLKVASRRAQKQTRQVMQNPKEKFFQLTSERETWDINRNLIAWQDGHVRQHRPLQANVSRQGPSTKNNKLVQTTINPQDLDHVDDSTWTASPSADSLSADSLSADSLSALRRSTNTTLSRILFEQQGLEASLPHDGASPTSSLISSATLGRLRTRVNLCAPRQNRAGPGTLQRTATHLRTAQVEHTMLDNASSSLQRPHIPIPNDSAFTFRHEPATAAQVPKLADVDEQVAAVRHVTTLLKTITVRKAKTPQRAKIPTKPGLCHIETNSHSFVTPGPEKVSDEAELATSLLARLTSDGSGGTAITWSNVWKAMHGWLDSYEQNRGIRTASENRRVEQIFRQCHKLVIERNVPVCDDFARKAAWFFSTFGMADPFDDKDHPHVGLPLFLRERETVAGSTPSEFDGITSLTCPRFGKPLLLRRSEWAAGLADCEPDDTTFHVFLRMLAISLDDKSKDTMSSTGGLSVDSKKANDLQSYINRLYPNSGRLLSEEDDVPKKDLASLWNRCSLYVVLYIYTVEGCRPRILQFQNLVDFSQSHIKACEIMLAIWGVLACFHAKARESDQLASLKHLSQWIQDMIQKMLVKWSKAHTELKDQLGGCPLQGSALYVLNRNRKVLESFLSKVFNTWRTAIGKCERHAAAAELLGDVEDLLPMTEVFFDNNSMLHHMIAVVDEYLHKYGIVDEYCNASANVTMSPVFHFINGMLRQRFSPNGTNKEESVFDCTINRKLTYDWSLIATALNKVEVANRDDFLEPVGQYSWERFSNAERSSKYKTLFVTHIIKTSEETYRDNKLWYLSYWLRCILRPLGDMAFEHELSNAVLNTDRYEPMLLGQPLVCEHGTNGFHLTLQDLKHSRTAIIERVVESIATASSAYDSQAVDPYALNPSDMAYVLEVMMDTLKATRTSLASRSDEQKEYDAMMRAVARKMDRFTNSIVPLDRWFRDHELVTFGRLSFRQAFGGIPLAGEVMTIPKRVVIWFQLTCQIAAIEHSQDPIREGLCNAYVDASSISETEWYQPKQLAMMQQVFPAYVELALTDAGALIGPPVLRCLDAICTNVFMRSVNIGIDDHTQLLEALSAIIVAARMALQRSNIDTIIKSVMERCLTPSELVAAHAMAFSCIVRIARIAILQYYEILGYTGLDQDSEEVEEIATHARFIYLFVRSQWDRVREGNNGHWKLSAFVDKYDLSDPEANGVKQFARAELEKELRENWAQDNDGFWWVSQGQRARQLHLSPVTETKKLLKAVKEEMQAYMDAFEGNSAQPSIEHFGV